MLAGSPTTMSSSGAGPHILVFPFPAQGHMLPLLDLTHQLALRGLTITILVTPKNLPILHPLLSTNPSIQPLVFPFPPHPSLPQGVENVKDVGNHGNCAIINSLGKLHHPIAHWFASHPSPPVAILSDFFLGWTHRLAAELGVPRIVFYSSGAFSVLVISHVLHNMRDLRGLPEVSFRHLPHEPTFPYHHLPSLFRLYRESDPDWEFVKDGVLANNSSWGGVFNTFEALEGDYLDHVRKDFGHVHVWAVGPILSEKNNGVGPTERGGAASVQASDVLTWLDGCSDESVVYVCFGSQFVMTKEQVEALGAGLEKSGTRFIWVVRDDKSGQDNVPDGFDSRVAGRGMVIRGWAPQVAILSHRAIGRFLTHCGWNSVMEGIAMGRLMLLAWPVDADQFANAKLLVEEMGVAVQVCEGASAVPDPDELARTIAGSLGGTRPEKLRAKELHDKALDSLKEGGTSRRDLDDLVRELFALNEKKREDQGNNDKNIIGSNSH